MSMARFILEYPAITFMKTLNKKELRNSVKETLTQMIGTLQIDHPSKKTTKLIEKTSKKLSRELNDELKKQTKKMEKAKAKKSSHQDDLTDQYKITG
jgi:hypothetical protein